MNKAPEILKEADPRTQKSTVSLTSEARNESNIHPDPDLLIQTEYNDSNSFLNKVVNSPRGIKSINYKNSNKFETTSFQKEIEKRAVCLKSTGTITESVNLSIQSLAEESYTPPTRKRSTS